MYRAAIIGCGKIGSEYADDPRIKNIYTHAGAYIHCQDTELVAVCDRDPEKAIRCKNRWDVHDCFTDYKKMIAVIKPDIVSVCTPDKTHYEIILTILTSSEVKAIFAEKPLALNVKDAEDIVKLAARKKVILAVNYSRRYAEKLFEMKSYLHSEKFGNIQTINGYYTKGTMHNGTHWFDLARFLVGDVRRVKGFDRLKEKNDDPTYESYIEFNNGATGFLHSCSEKQFSIFEMDILGSKGRISLKESGHILELYGVTDSPYYSGYQSLYLSDIFINVMKDAILHAIENIVHCIRTNQTPRCSGNDGVAALKIAHAVGSSIASGNFIDLEY